MPRRSLEALSVVATPIVRVFPAPPDSLSTRQQEIFRDIVHSREPDYFDAPGLLLLACLARHAQASERISAEIEAELASEAPSDKRLALLARMRSIESSALVSLSTKLRLTNQSRLSATVGRTSAERGAKLALPKPWESVEVARARRSKADPAA